MARKRAKASAAAPKETPNVAAPADAAESATKAVSKPKAKPKPSSHPTARKRRAGKPVRVSAKKPASRAKRSPRPERRVRKRHSDAQRQHILATAQREELTGNEVSKRFGISTITYYLWRKKAGSSTPRVRARSVSRSARTSLDGGLVADVRKHVRAQIAAMLPGLIQEEVIAALGLPRRGRPRRA